MAESQPQPVAPDFFGIQTSESGPVRKDSAEKEQTDGDASSSKLKRDKAGREKLNVVGEYAERMFRKEQQLTERSESVHRRKTFSEKMFATPFGKQSLAYEFSSIDECFMKTNVVDRVYSIFQSKHLVLTVTAMGLVRFDSDNVAPFHGAFEQKFTTEPTPPSAKQRASGQSLDDEMLSHHIPNAKGPESTAMSAVNPSSKSSQIHNFEADFAAIDDAEVFKNASGSLREYEELRKSSIIYANEDSALPLNTLVEPTSPPNDARQLHEERVGDYAACGGVDRGDFQSTTLAKSKPEIQTENQHVNDVPSSQVPLKSDSSFINPFASRRKRQALITNVNEQSSCKQETLNAAAESSDKTDSDNISQGCAVVDCGGKLESSLIFTQTSNPSRASDISPLAQESVVGENADKRARKAATAVNESVDDQPSDEVPSMFSLPPKLKELTGMVPNLEAVDRQKVAQFLVENSILYDEDGLVALNKPHGIAVHHGKGRSLSLASSFALLAPQLRPPASRLQLLHRLDRQTSGVLLIAKNNETCAEIRRLFNAKEIIKKYWCITVGVPNPPCGVIDVPLAEVKLGQKFMVMPSMLRSIRGETKQGVHRAITEYSIVAEGVSKSCALVECKIPTGIMHQIRCHLASIHTPILGDVKYSNPDFLSRAKQELPPQIRYALDLRGPRSTLVKYLPMYLHAKEVQIPRFSHLQNGDTANSVAGPVIIRAPLPDYFVWTLKRLKLALPK